MQYLRKSMRLLRSKARPLDIALLNAVGLARTITGNPDSQHVLTSYAERMNLTIRMMNRRFTRVTNAHSKKVENHIHFLNITFMWYNFARINQALRVTACYGSGSLRSCVELERNCRAVGLSRSRCYTAFHSSSVISACRKIILMSVMPISDS